MFKAQCVVILSLVVTIQCGGNMEGFIVGGELADIKQFPYAAYLSVRCTGPIPHAWACGSSIVNQDILLTAAHCLSDCLQSIKIHISAASSQKYKGHVTRGINYLYHELFDSRKMNYDIGLVRMKNRLPLNAMASRVALMRNPPPVKEAKVAGWGVVDQDKGITINHLKFLKQRVWTKNECQKVYGKISVGKLCAALDTSQFPSGGDSGSALVVNGYIQIGLVSYKKPKITNYLIVYTDVSYFYDWIKQQAKVLYCKNK